MKITGRQLRHIIRTTLLRESLIAEQDGSQFFADADNYKNAAVIHFIESMKADLKAGRSPAIPLNILSDEEAIKQLFRDDRQLRDVATASINAKVPRQFIDKLAKMNDYGQYSNSVYNTIARAVSDIFSGKTISAGQSAAGGGSDEVVISGAEASKKMKPAVALQVLDTAGLPDYLTQKAAASVAAQSRAPSVGAAKSIVNDNVKIFIEQGYDKGMSLLHKVESIVGEPPPYKFSAYKDDPAVTYFVHAAVASPGTESPSIAVYHTDGTSMFGKFTLKRDFGDLMLWTADIEFVPRESGEHYLDISCGSSCTTSFSIGYR